MPVVGPLGYTGDVRFQNRELQPDVSIGPAGKISQHSVETGLSQTGMQRAEPGWQQTDVGVLTIRHPGYVGKNNFHRFNTKKSGLVWPGFFIAGYVCVSIV